ncbi:hypothetical protein C8T65DRAFT_270517 [Cerioporus squamosus]|nr:hypothetical protein C8T65DRAFT_270517 [Cerioporus squamosus]
MRCPSPLPPVWCEPYGGHAHGTHAHSSCDAASGGLDPLPLAQRPSGDIDKKVRDGRRSERSRAPLMWLRLGARSLSSSRLVINAGPAASSTVTGRRRHRALTLLGKAATSVPDRCGRCQCGFGLGPGIRWTHAASSNGRQGPEREGCERTSWQRSGEAQCGFANGARSGLLARIWLDARLRCGHHHMVRCLTATPGAYVRACRLPSSLPSLCGGRLPGDRCVDARPAASAVHSILSGLGERVVTRARRHGGLWFFSQLVLPPRSRRGNGVAWEGDGEVSAGTSVEVVILTGHGIVDRDASAALSISDMYACARGWRRRLPSARAFECPNSQIPEFSRGRAVRCGACPTLPVLSSAQAPQ